MLEKPGSKQYGMTMATRLLVPASPKGSKPLDQPILICGSEGGHLSCWSLTAGKLCMASRLHKEPMLSFDLTGDGCHGVSGGAGKQLCSFTLDFQQLSMKSETVMLDQEGISDVRIRCDGQTVATAGWDKRVRLFSLRTWKPLAVLRFHSESVHAVDFACPQSSAGVPPADSKPPDAAGGKSADVARAEEKIDCAFAE